jgi:hypothetical protein
LRHQNVGHYAGDPLAFALQYRQRLDSVTGHEYCVSLCFQLNTQYLCMTRVIIRNQKRLCTYFRLQKGGQLFRKVHTVDRFVYVTAVAQIGGQLRVKRPVRSAQGDHGYVTQSRIGLE